MAYLALVSPIMNKSAQANAPTITDVAVRAGVSAFTANDAFVRPERLSPETVQAVRRAADELGYKRRDYNRRFRIPALAYMDPRPGDGPLGVVEWWIKQARALQIAAFKQDARVITFTADPDSNDPVGELKRWWQSKTVVGFLLTDPFVDGADTRINWLVENGVPFVLMGRAGDTSKYNWVDFDDERAMEELTGELILRGHRAIARFGYEDDGTTPPKHRRSGYERAMRRAGLEGTHAEVRYGDAGPSHNSSGAQHGESLSRVKDLLSARSNGEKLTAIVCDTDDFALQVLRVAHQSKVAIQVTGIDNTQARRKSIVPFPSADVDWPRAGDRAIRLLLRRVKDPETLDNELLQFEILGRELIAAINR